MAREAALGASPRATEPTRPDGVEAGLPDGAAPAEPELVAAAQADPAAFAPLYRRYLRPVYGYVRARVRSRAEAEDLTGEVFVRALRALPAYRERGRPFAAWLFAIARNVVADRRRSGRADAPIDAAGALADGAGDAALGLVRREELARLAAALDALPGAQRDVVVLKFFGQRTHREIAELFGRSEPAVKMLLQRALARLRRAYDEGEAP
jgi:RNA polymerase sigma-70 factor (ECF subfamily)